MGDEAVPPVKHKVQTNGDLEHCGTLRLLAHGAPRRQSNHDQMRWRCHDKAPPTRTDD
ncbi:hypothetical protein Mapa_013996 [Marchantia paleacea]|nr:hypothetical protein Mapa_013996 [Marchantia paleacea]